MRWQWKSVTVESEPSIPSIPFMIILSTYMYMHVAIAVLHRLIVTKRWLK